MIKQEDEEDIPIFIFSPTPTDDVPETPQHASPREEPADVEYEERATLLKDMGVPAEKLVEEVQGIKILKSMS